MQSNKSKRLSRHPLIVGISLTLLGFSIACALWPIWALSVKSIYFQIAGDVLTTVEPSLVSQLIKVVSEGTFFWMMINSWIWLTLVLGNPGKNLFTDKQPIAGIWYTLCSWVLGVVAFLILISFLGIWWHPFNLATMFTPANEAQIRLAILAWDTANFYALAVIIAQIPLVSLFHKWPFGGNAEPPYDSIGVLSLGTAVTWIVWMALIVPSWMDLSLAGKGVVTPPFGRWPAFIAFCQAYIIFAILPVEGGENYPMKLISKRQPLMGLTGFAIAVFAGLTVPPLMKMIIIPLDILPGVPPDVVVASLELSVIVFMLAWHHLFDDYPNQQRVSNQARRIGARISIWLVGGTVWGLVWLQIYTYLPFGANDLGLGVPALGILAGQFSLLMPLLYLNTFFDKWPVVGLPRRSFSENPREGSRMV
ncbi:hypothetical protein HBA55_27865 [Pseudomaricurvus alkylphenolicus]|uniref:hypothetical protein n=1 Tax=Pseudomaricurvus alkylphenolicus TaxID=1306991 RepID=UPI00142039DC|nr:hypothetical protein [Pseudomaricurvus alkylphenolicus]NIB43457.1 hypothetical protein [Pseudomaricurvus alkylphenolicus]